MKNLILLSTTLLLFACGSPEPAKIDYVVFSGKVSNGNAEEVLVYGKDFKQAISIVDGMFSDTLHIINDGYYSFRIGRESSALYLSQGKNIHLNINPEEFDESIVYSGPGAPESNVLAKLYMTRELMIPSFKDHYALEEAEFMAKTMQLKNDILQVIKEGETNESFKMDQEKEANYEAILAMERYESYHSHYAKLDSFSVSSEFVAAIPEYSVDNEEEFAKLPIYQELVKYDFNKKVGAEEELSGDYDQALITVGSKLKAGPLKDELLNSMATYMLSPNESLEATYAFFMNNVSKEDYKASYQEKYEKLKLLSRGLPSPTFDSYENHAGDSTSFTDLLGKYTYVDVWATWCGPCIAEIPSLKEVEKSYHDKNIQFVSISVDRQDDHETWVKMVKDKELSGIQLFADQDWKSEFIAAYQINSIPRFLLIDPEGNIISADAPRPSNPKLIELFTSLGI